MRVAARPSRNPAGVVTRWFGTATDIHENRLADERRDLLALELTHRLKNLFSLVHAITLLSATAQQEVQAHAKGLAARFLALGQAYGGNAAGPGDGQSLLSLMRRLFSPYDDLRGRVRLEGADLQISDDAAIALSLIQHELLTNAAKYGALAIPHGRIEVLVALTQDCCRISWQEHGNAAPLQPVHRAGFGTRLIACTVEHQLQGTVQRTWADGGLRMVLELPLARLARPGPGQRAA